MCLCVCAWADIHRERVTQTYLTTWVTGWESAYKWPFQTHGFLDAIWVVSAHICRPDKLTSRLIQKGN